MDVIEQAVVAGDTVLIENLEETIDPVIDPLLGRHTIKKGRYRHTHEHVCTQNEQLVCSSELLYTPVSSRVSLTAV